MRTERLATQAEFHSIDEVISWLKSTNGFVAYTVKPILRNHDGTIFVDDDVELKSPPANSTKWILEISIDACFEEVEYPDSLNTIFAGSSCLDLDYVRPIPWFSCGRHSLDSYAINDEKMIWRVLMPLNWNNATEASRIDWINHIFGFSHDMKPTYRQRRITPEENSRWMSY